MTFEVDVTWFSKMLDFPWETRTCSKSCDPFSILVAGNLKVPIGSSSLGAFVHDLATWMFQTSEWLQNLSL